MKNNIVKIIILLVVITLLVTGGIFVYSKKYSRVSLPENNFDTTMTVPNTNISFKYPGAGFYGLGVKFLGPGLEPGADMTQVKQIGFEHTAPMDPAKVSEYINFYIGFVIEKENIKGDYTLENAVKSIKEVYDPMDIDSGRYETFNSHKFYIHRTDNRAGLEGWLAYFLQDDGVYKVTINYFKPDNPIYGEESDTAGSRVAYENNDLLFEEILKNVSF